MTTKQSVSLAPVPALARQPADGAGGRALAATRRALRVPLLVAAAWTLVGVFAIASDSVQALTRPGGTFAWDEAKLSIESMAVWALFTPIIFALAERFPIERARWGRRLAIHLGLAIGMAWIDVCIDRVLQPLLVSRPPPSLARAFFGQSFINLYSYFAVLGIGLALRFYRLYHERKLRVARLETELVQTKLDTLEMQLRPHFLYNTLHSISALVRTHQSAEAVRVLAGLGDLLRHVLRKDGAHEVPLEDELAFAARYLAIEEIRFGERLRVTIDVSEEVARALVPHFLLQPLVENAVRHGVEGRGTGHVTIAAQRAGDTLRIHVDDSGGGPDRAGSGIGLGATRARLAHLYGERQRLALLRAGAGTRVEIELPFHESLTDPAGSS